MDLKNQRRMAAEILKCGVNRVWIDPNKIEDVAEAVTRGDVRSMINSGTIRALQKKGVSRGRARLYSSKKAKGHHRGHGSRKGAKKARSPKKEAWMKTIRPIRRQLKELRDEGKITREVYRKFYLKAKGGAFKSKAHLESHLVSEGYLKE